MKNLLKKKILELKKNIKEDIKLKVKKNIMKSLEKKKIYIN